jgi:hypothetical protein
MRIKKLSLTLGAVLAFASSQANAWFFFIPGSVTGKVADAFTGAEGENCVGPNAKIGDIIRNPSGNTATIKSLSGTSTRCQDPNLPIRALLEFQFNAPKAGLNIPDGYEQRSLTDMQRLQGFVLKAENPAKHTGFMVRSLKRSTGGDPATIAHNMSESMLRVMDNSKTANPEELTINGLRAWRFEMTGKNKGLFGVTNTYLVTVLAGEDEILTVNAWAPVDNYLQEKEEFKELVASVKGLAATIEVAKPIESSKPPVQTVAEPVASAPVSVPVTEAAPVPTKVSSSTAALTVTTATESTGEGVSSMDLTVRKLRELDKLYKDGILNKAEYESKKKDLLKAL